MSEDITGVETTLQDVDVPSTPAGADFNSLIPEAYAEKGWVKDVKDMDGLFKMADDLKSEMGKRPAGIPHADATPETWAEFNKALGVPESSDSYELAPVEGQEAYQAGLKSLLHEAGITPKQLGVLAPGFDKLMGEMTPADGPSDEEFSQISDKHLGDRKDEIMGNAQVLLDEMAAGIPQELKDVFNGLPNRQLVALAAGLDVFKSKYINEDSLPQNNGGNPTGAMSTEDKNAKRLELLGSEAYNNMRHPNHAEVAAKVAELYGT